MLFLSVDWLRIIDRSMSKRTVVVIEDEPDAAELFAEMMRVSGFQTVTSYSSAPAIDLIASHKPDVVIMDVMMPDISGLDLLKSMRGKPELAGIPVILVSALAFPADIKTGLDAGASAYLTKPVDFIDLARTVEKVISAG